MITYEGTYDGITYHLALREYDGDRVHARVRLRSTRGVLLAAAHEGSLDVIIPPVRATDALRDTEHALAQIGTPIGEWHLFLAAHEQRVGLIADRWYHRAQPLATVEIAYGAIPLQNGLMKQDLQRT